MLAAVSDRCVAIQGKGKKSWLTMSTIDESNEATKDGVLDLAPFYKRINEHDRSCGANIEGEIAALQGSDPDFYSQRHITCVCVCICVCVSSPPLPS